MEGKKELSQNLSSKQDLELLDATIELSDEELDMVQGAAGLPAAQGLQGTQATQGAQSGLPGAPGLGDLASQGASIPFVGPLFQQLNQTH